MSAEKTRSEKFERGLKTRRAVLGADYVDNSLAQADDFNWSMQQLTTEWCWDEIWNRPGLDRRSRSVLNLGMIAALSECRSRRFGEIGAAHHETGSQQPRRHRQPHHAKADEGDRCHAGGSRVGQMPISLNTSLAMRKLSIAAGTPQ